MSLGTAGMITALATCALAVATLVYALATRRLATAAREGVRAQVLSDARLAWIDSVRDAIAEFLSLDAEVKHERAKQLGPEFIDNLLQRRLMIRHRIEFRLNPDEADHRELLEAIDALISDAVHSRVTEKKIRQLTVQISEDEWRRTRRDVDAPTVGDRLGRRVRLHATGTE